jgi:hypothetical protein
MNTVEEKGPVLFQADTRNVFLFLIADWFELEVL